MPTYLVKINNVTLPHLKGYKVQRNKLWTDAGRNMSGDLIATFIGIFPKLKLSFGAMYYSDIQTLINLLDQPSFTVAYWDRKSGTYKTGLYYAGDYEDSLMRKDTGLYDPFDVDLIPFSKNNS